MLYTSHRPNQEHNKRYERTSMNETKHLLYKNIYLSFYSRKGHTVCCKFEREREMERHILREMTSSCPISSSRSQEVPMLAPPCKPYRQRRPNAFDRLRVPRSSLDSDWTVLIWPRGFHTPMHCHLPVY